MTDQEINEAIAKSCGFDEYCKECCGGMVEYHDIDGTYLRSSSCSCGGHPLPIPNYCTDLNAMHEAEMILTDLREYCLWITDVCRGGTYMPQNYEEMFQMVNATARQRAEAFLRTKGLWIQK